MTPAIKTAMERAQLIDEVKKLLPENWIVNPEKEVVKMVRLQDDSAEFQQVMRDMWPFLNGFDVLIFRIENPFAYARFSLRRHEYESRRGTSFETKRLYHATGQRKLKSITVENLDWRKTKRGRFGRGVSFSTDPAYTNRWCNWDNNVQRAILVCDVLVGNTAVGAYNKTPRGDSDTSTDRDGRVIVKHAEDEFYPKYAVHYTITKEMYESFGIDSKHEKLIKKYEKNFAKLSLN